MAAEEEARKEWSDEFGGDGSGARLVLCEEREKR
jgi:hypothetical protein